MKLYEIDQNLRSLWSKIADQDGEITEEDWQALNELELARDEKIKGYGVIIREMQADIDDCKANIDRLNEIHSKLKNRQEWLKTRLVEFMQNNNMPKYESLEVNISFRKSNPLHDGDMKDLPSEFIKTTIKEEPDKEAIKKYIKDGGEIEGWYIEEKQNIQIK